MKKTVQFALCLALMSSSAWANLPNSKNFSYVLQDDNGSECNLNVSNGTGGQSSYSMDLVIDSPRYVIDSSELNTSTLHQDGPDQTVLSDQKGHWFYLTYASLDSNKALSKLEVKDGPNGHTLGTCGNLTLVIFN
jgi:hypothetical protein